MLVCFLFYPFSFYLFRKENFILPPPPILVAFSVFSLLSMICSHWQVIVHYYLLFYLVSLFYLRFDWFLFFPFNSSVMLLSIWFTTPRHSGFYLFQTSQKKSSQIFGWYLLLLWSVSYFFIFICSFLSFLLNPSTYIMLRPSLRLCYYHHNASIWFAIFSSEIPRHISIS